MTVHEVLLAYESR